MNEIKDLHPLVANWLIENGYDYKHEYSLPDYGIVDFYATHRETGFEAMVECKIDGISKGIMQLATYDKQVAVNRSILACPVGMIKDRDKRLAQRYTIEIVEFAIENTTVSDADTPIPAVIDAFARFDFIDCIADTPHETIPQLIAGCPNVVSKFMTAWTVYQLVLSRPDKQRQAENVYQFCLSLVTDNPEIAPLAYPIMKTGDIQPVIKKLRLGWV